MKRVQERKIDSRKIRSHPRCRREDVLALKKQCARARQDAFAELGALDTELDEISRQSVGEVLDTFPGDLLFTDTDEGEYHIHAAATH